MNQSTQTADVFDIRGVVMFTLRKMTVGLICLASLGPNVASAKDDAIRVEGLTAAEWAERIASPPSKTVLERATRLDWRRFGFQATDAVPILAKALASKRVEERDAALISLRQLGPLARAAAPELVKGINKDWGVAALSVLRVIGCNENDCVTVASKYAAKDSSLVADVLGASGNDALKAINLGLSAKNERVLRAMLYSVKRLGPLAGAVSARVAELAGEERFRSDALDALQALGPAGAPAASRIATLVPTIGGKDGFHQLGVMGPAASKHVQGFIEFLDDANPATAKCARGMFLAVAPTLIPRAAGVDGEHAESAKAFNGLSDGTGGNVKVRTDLKTDEVPSDETILELCAWLRAYRADVGVSGQQITRIELNAQQRNEWDAADGVLKLVERCPELTALYLDRRLLGDSIGKLGALGNLKRLTIRNHWNEISADRFALLAELPSLESVRVRGPWVTDSHIETLVGCSTLAELEFEKTRVTSKGIAAFRKLRPDVALVADGKKHAAGPKGDVGQTEPGRKQNAAAESTDTGSRQKPPHGSAHSRSMETVAIAGMIFCLAEQSVSGHWEGAHVSPRNSLAVAYGRDKLLIIDIKQSKVLFNQDPESTLSNRRATGGYRSVRRIAFSPDCEFIIVNDNRLWSAASGDFVEIPGSPASCIAFSPDGQELAVASRGERDVRHAGIVIYDWPGLTENRRFEAFNLACEWLAYTRDGKSLLAIVQDPTSTRLTELEATNFKEVPVADWPKAANANAAPLEFVRADRMRGPEQKQLRAAGLLLQRVEGYCEARILGAASIAKWQINNDWFLNVSELTRAVATGKTKPVPPRDWPPRFELKPGARAGDIAKAQASNYLIQIHNGAPSSLDLARDGSFAVSGDANGEIAAWNPRNGQVSCKIKGFEAPINAIGISTDKTHVCAAAQDGTVKLWKLATAGELAAAAKLPHDAQRKPENAVPKAVPDKVDGRSLSEWESALRAGTHADRLQAIASLQQFGGSATKSLAWVIAKSAVNSGEEQEAELQAAADAVAVIGPAAKGAMPALTNAAKRKASNADTRIKTIRALGAIGPDAKPALPLLQELAKGDDAEIREEALKSLSAISGNDKLPMAKTEPIRQKEQLLRDGFKEAEETIRQRIPFDQQDRAMKVLRELQHRTKVPGAK